MGSGCTYLRPVLQWTVDTLRLGGADPWRVWLAPLATLADPALVPQAVAAAGRALGRAAYAAAWAEGWRQSPEQATAEALLAADTAGASAPGRTPAPEVDALTPREREIAALLAHGLTNRQIAEALVISEGTARIHAEHVLGKLALHSRVQVAAWAREHGLLADEDT